MEPEKQDDTTEIEKELKTRFSLLPADLQKIITSSDYQMRLYELAQKYKLTYEQLATLEMNTTFVLLGMTDPRVYERELSADLNKKTEDLKPLIKEVEEQVFNPIRESLKNLYAEEEKVEEEDLMPPAMTAKPSSEVIGNRSQVQGNTGGQVSASSFQVSGNTQSKPPLEVKPVGMAVPKAPYATGQVQGSGQVIGTGYKVQGNAGEQTTDSRDKTKDSSTVQNTDAKPIGNIVADKLKDTWTVPATKTDYTIKKMGDKEMTGMDKSGDPYREPIG